MVCPLFIFSIAVVVIYWEARMLIHQQKLTLAIPCFFCVIYNKKYNRFVVRFKLNRGPSGCRTMCGEPYGSFCSIHNQNTVLSTTYTNSNSLNHPGLCHTPKPRSLFLRNEKLAQLLGTQMGRIIFILLRTTFIVLTLLI